VTARVMRPLRTRHTRQRLASYDETLALVRMPWQQRLEQAAIMERKLTEYIKAARASRSPGWFAPRWPPAFAGVGLFQAAYELAARRVPVAALAVERYRRANRGDLPPSLEALVPAYVRAVPQDPFSGAPLVYKQGPQDYLIYSVDNNRTDDGGVFYGIGSRGQMAVRTGEPRDFGIRVPITPESIR